MTTVVKTKHVTSSVRHVSPCVGQTRVPRMPRVLASTTNRNVLVTQELEEIHSFALAASDVRMKRFIFTDTKS